MQHLCTDALPLIMTDLESETLTSFPVGRGNVASRQHSRADAEDSICDANVYVLVAQACVEHALLKNRQSCVKVEQTHCLARGERGDRRWRGFQMGLRPTPRNMSNALAGNGRCCSNVRLVLCTVPLRSHALDGGAENENGNGMGDRACIARGTDGGRVADL